jgi:polyphosphate kinase 2 (PPK2 family)
VVKVVALGKPTEREQSQWYFQRYVERLPAAGEMVLFDRSWYNRATVERVMDFCTDEEYQEFLRSAPEFERMLVRSGIVLIKYWFSISDEEQERRFRKRSTDRNGAGSSARSTSRPGSDGSSTRGRKTQCSPTRTRVARRGT